MIAFLMQSIGQGSPFVHLVKGIPALIREDDACLAHLYRGGDLAER
jgi:hypothetical protein